MTDVERLVAVAHRRLALRRMLVAIERNPKLLDEEAVMPLTIKKPIELAGLKTHLIRVEAAEKKIAGLHKRYDAVVPGIEELVTAHTVHVGDLETYEGELRRKIEGMVGSNGGGDDDDPLQTGLDGQPGQVISSETQEG